MTETMEPTGTGTATVHLPGAVWTDLQTDSSWPTEVPERWARLTERATTRRYGRGYVLTLTDATAADLVDLGEYVASRAGALAAACDDMRAERHHEPRDRANARRERDAWETAAARIEDATGWSVRGYAGGRTERTDRLDA